MVTGLWDYTEEDLERRLRRQPDNRVPAIDRFVQWACSNLTRVGALTRNTGVWSVTNSGRTVAEEELPDLVRESRRRREEGRRWWASYPEYPRGCPRRVQGVRAGYQLRRQMRVFVAEAGHSQACSPVRTRAPRSAGHRSRRL